MTNPIIATVTGKQLIRDHYGNLVEIDAWSHDIARELARQEGIELTPEHLRVLDYLREYAIEHGGSREDAHQILRTLEGRFAQEGGGRWLYTLFPGGPVRQGMKLAGLPEAPHAADPSFGSVS
ncbi:MAG: TusE/DsrC/DsvC family sulfur relay protein [Rubrivivax sp.]|nr:TusE/DsrC/DsvC family sulfur relay protein [Rubrivivax sp.]